MDSNEIRPMLLNLKPNEKTLRCEVQLFCNLKQPCVLFVHKTDKFSNSHRLCHEWRHCPEKIYRNKFICAYSAVWSSKTNAHKICTSYFLGKCWLVNRTQVFTVYVFEFLYTYSSLYCYLIWNKMSLVCAF